MEIMDLISSAILIAVVAVGIVLKCRTRRALGDMDGISPVETQGDDDVIARL